MLVHMVCMLVQMQVCILVHRVCMLVQVCMLWYRFIKGNGKATCNYEAKNYIDEMYKLV